MSSVNLDPSGSNPVEVLLVGPLIDGVNYIYYTQDLDTELNWKTFKFVGTGGGNTKSIQTIYGTGAYIYTAAASAHNTQKPVVSVYTVSETGGIISIDSSSDLSLRSNAIIGKGAADVVGLDSMIAYKNKIYAANNGGIVYSSSYTSFSSFASAVPSALTGTTLQLPSVANGGLGKLTPGQRGIPKLVEYNNMLYIARNVSDGTVTDSEYSTVSHGELWRCDPAGGSDPNACEPGDRTLLIKGTESDLSATNAISLLQPNGTGVLYVGFDSVSGVQIFRIESTSPVATGAGTLGPAFFILLLNMQFTLKKQPGL